MNKAKAIPQECLTVGEVAKKMGGTARTLQYYDAEGLLSPSAASEGGRRLYAHEDIVKLHQILSLRGDKAMSRAIRMSNLQKGRGRHFAD